MGQFLRGQPGALQSSPLVISPAHCLPPFCASCLTSLLDVRMPPQVFVHGLHVSHIPQLQSTEEEGQIYFLCFTQCLWRSQSVGPVPEVGDGRGGRRLGPFWSGHKTIQQPRVCCKKTNSYSKMSPPMCDPFSTAETWPELCQTKKVQGISKALTREITVSALV